MNPVVHFEMPYKDRKRVVKFYSGVFGWQTQSMDSDLGDYIVASTVKSDTNGRPVTAGGINGGFFPKSPKTAQVPSVVISVANIKAKMAEVKAAGGKVLGQPVEIPSVGRYVSFTDTEGNRVSLLQPTR